MLRIGEFGLKGLRLDYNFLNEGIMPLFGWKSWLLLDVGSRKWTNNKICGGFVKWLSMKYDFKDYILKKGKHKFVVDSYVFHDEGT